MTEDDGEFRLRLGRIRARPIRTRQGRSFVARVVKAAHQAGPGFPTPACPALRPSTFGRGRVAAWQAQRLLSARSRRVIVKAWVVRLRGATAALTTHLSYLRREGVTRDGSRTQLFDAASDRVDAEAFARRCQPDRHHFRFTVSPEDAAELADLKAYTRDLMDQMERDLGTRLEWAAVDHWNTDNPHVHIVVRGRAAEGGDLVISRDYIARGLRARAAELATLELGPQSVQELRTRLAREVDAERWTRLDRALRSAADANGVIDLRPPAQNEQRNQPRNPARELMIGRAQRLERMGLAQAIGPAQWRLADDAEATLRQLGERGDIVRTMQRAYTAARQPRAVAEFALPDGDQAPTIIGRVIDKGLADELTGSGYLVVDGTDGRGHYVRLAALADLDEVSIGGIVAVAPARPKPADRTIAQLAAANHGLYQPEQHRAQLTRDGEVSDPAAIIEAHVRRLEALRRRGLVERFSDGRWSVSPDLLQRVQADDRRRGGMPEVEVRVLSAQPVERLVNAPGATWLDRELVARVPTERAEAGFGHDLGQALRARAEHLVGQGLAQRQGTRVILVRDLLATLERRELAAAARQIATASGLSHRTVADGDPVRGVYRRRLDLVSGRFALIEDGRQFVLVPWRPVIEHRLGQEVAGVVRAGGVSWQFGRDRGLEP